MMKKNYLILLLICVTLASNSPIVCAQERQTTDSLLNILETTTIDTIKVEVLNSLCKKYRRSHPEKAEDYVMQALQLAKKNDYKNGIATSFNNIGIIHYYQGNYVKAIDYFQKALKIKKELDDKKGIAANLNNIGVINFYHGNYDKAIEYYLKALKIRKIIGDNKGSAANLNNIGLIYKNLGNYDKAIEYFQKSLKINQEFGDKMKIAINFANIGLIHINLGNYVKAIEYYQKALKIKKDLGDKRGIAASLNNIGLIHKNQGNYNKAVECHQKAMKIRKELGDKIGIARSLINVGIIYTEQGNYDNAIEYFQKALKIAYEIGTKSEIIQFINLFGNLYQKQGSFKKALNYYQKALMENITNFNDSVIHANPQELNALSKPYLLETLNAKAKTFYSKFNDSKRPLDINTSISTYNLLFKLIHEMRSDYNHESTQLLLSENTKGYYADAISVAIDFDKVNSNKKSSNKAFEYLEKSKSATLTANLNDIEIKKFWNIADSLLEKDKNIAINRRYYNTKIQEAKSQKEGYDTLLVQEYQEKLFNYSRQQDSLLGILKSEYPDYYKLKYQQIVANVDEIQNQLNENAALINYFLADTTLFIATITKDIADYKMVKIDSLFNQKLIDYHIDIKSGFMKEETATSYYLYKMLIDPIKDLIKEKDNLVIIPDGHLFYLPFETLCSHPNLPKKLSNIEYLIKKHSVTYHQSATLWLNNSNQPNNNIAVNKSFVGFAPVFDPKKENGYILSKNWITDTTNTDITLRSVSADFKQFNKLPYSEVEVKTIIDLFDKQNSTAQGYFHLQASEENFKKNVSKYSFIHIASHSFINDKYPALSGIAFSQPDSTSYKDEEHENGILYANESYNLDLRNTELVVLSSCKSGLGKLVKGEGFLSISRGFLYAGVSNIIYSIWNVKDEATKNLMIEFYKLVLKGNDYATSLRMAKLKLLRNKSTSDPKYWAAWSLIGG